MQDSFSLLGKGGVMNALQFPMRDEVICIGTEPEACAIVYPRGTAGIEPIHCQLVPNDDGSWIIVDLSEAGVWLNGRRMSKGQPMPLKTGDEVIIANANNSFVMIGDRTVSPTDDHSAERRHEDGFKDKFFNFNGRLNRQRYILRRLPLLFLGLVFSGIFGLIDEGVIADEQEYITFILLILAVVLSCSALSLDARRLHDLDKTGKWAALNFAPGIGLVFFIYLCCVKGTVGANRFGPDPLE